MLDADRKLIAELKPAMIVATKNGELDEANAINAVIHQGARQADPFNGVWEVHFPGIFWGKPDNIRRYMIKGGSVVMRDIPRHGDSAAKFEIVGGVGYGDFPVQPSNDRREAHRFTIIGRRLLVEIFASPDVIRASPNQMGIGSLK